MINRADTAREVLITLFRASLSTSKHGAGGSLGATGNALVWWCTFKKLIGGERVNY